MLVRAAPRFVGGLADYLELRRSLSGIVLMIDARLGATDLDRQLLSFVAQRVGRGEVRLLVLLTKADKLSRNQAHAALAATTTPKSLKV